MTFCKLSALLYSIYVNELTEIHKLIGADLFDKLTLRKNSSSDNIAHTTVNYVNDSSSIISSKNIQE